LIKYLLKITYFLFIGIFCSWKIEGKPTNGWYDKCGGCFCGRTESISKELQKQIALFKEKLKNECEFSKQLTEEQRKLYAELNCTAREEWLLDENNFNTLLEVIKRNKSLKTRCNLFKTQIKKKEEMLQKRVEEINKKEIIIKIKELSCQNLQAYFSRRIKEMGEVNEEISKEKRIFEIQLCDIEIAIGIKGMLNCIARMTKNLTIISDKVKKSIDFLNQIATDNIIMSGVSIGATWYGGKADSLINNYNPKKEKSLTIALKKNCIRLLNVGAIRIGRDYVENYIKNSRAIRKITKPFQILPRGLQVIAKDMIMRSLALGLWIGEQKVFE
jgi:hypothetical protein